MTPRREFPLPDLGEGLTEGEIIKWLVAEGEIITLNQPIVEVETAKAAVEIPAKWAGKVLRIYQPEGATVEVGTPIIAIDTEPTAGDSACQNRPRRGELPEGGEPGMHESAAPPEGGAGGRTGGTGRIRPEERSA